MYISATKVMIAISGIIFATFIIVVFADTVELPEDAILRVPSLIRKYGYPVEIHHVETTDGYILEMHRIPHGKNGDSGKPKKVVFLQHGLLCSSADFIIIGPDNALAYILADAGYDVWLGNARGNTYSRKHKAFDANLNAKKFWDFSWHEIGVFDLPAMIDYVLRHTGQEKLYYVGHSQGTTSFYVMCSERPEYNSKIIFMVSLAPVAYMGHMTSPLLRVISTFERTLGVLFKMLGQYEFLPHSTLLSEGSNQMCHGGSNFKTLCKNSLFALCGYNEKQMNETLIPIISGHNPAGSSTMQVRHYAQGFISKKFAKFNYDMPGRNLLQYGKLFPPEYNLTRIAAPIYLFYSKNDWLSNDVDVIQLSKEVLSVVKLYLISDTEFNHADYLYGIDVVKLVYKPILNLLKTGNID